MISGPSAAKRWDSGPFLLLGCLSGLSACLVRKARFFSVTQFPTHDDYCLLLQMGNFSFISIPSMSDLSMSDEGETHSSGPKRPAAATVKPAHAAFQSAPFPWWKLHFCCGTLVAADRVEWKQPPLHVRKGQAGALAVEDQQVLQHWALRRLTLHSQQSPWPCWPWGECGLVGSQL